MTETHDEEERFDSNSDKKNNPLICFTKKRGLSVNERKAPSKRRIKRRRFSSPFSADSRARPYNGAAYVWAYLSRVKWKKSQSFHFQKIPER